MIVIILVAHDAVKRCLLLELFQKYLRCGHKFELILFAKPRCCRPTILATQKESFKSEQFVSDGV
jgi:hypothetical protein